MADSEEKLVRLLRYVSEHNDYYKNRIKEYRITNPLDITQWPVLTRKELQENRYNMFSDGYKSKYFDQQLRRQSSSGSTGTPVNVYWDYKDWYASNMCLWRKRREWYGIKPSDKHCVFTLNAFEIKPEDGKIYYTNDPKNIFSFNVSLIRDENGYKQMAKLINDYQPDWLYIQPFVLKQLIGAYIKSGIEPIKTIRYIECVGEILTLDLRKRAEELFHIKVTNMYGSEEMNGIAIENPKGEMQILTDNVFLETKKGDVITTQGEGRAIITNLNNFAMPIIRYSQGDIIDVGDSINLLSGRSLFSYGLETLNSLTLSNIIADINNQFFDSILNFSFNVDEKSSIVNCYIYIDKDLQGWESAVETAMHDRFRELYNNITLNCNVVVDKLVLASKKLF